MVTTGRSSREPIELPVPSIEKSFLLQKVDVKWLCFDGLRLVKMFPYTQCRQTLLTISTTNLRNKALQKPSTNDANH